MILPTLSVILIVLPAITASIFQLSAWPFESYPMFSTPISPRGLSFIRIAYEDSTGRLHWWKPHYYKLVETFGHEAKTCLMLPPPIRERHLDRLLARIEHCLDSDPAAKKAVSICLVQRRLRRSQPFGWYPLDICINRHPISRTTSK